MFNKRRKRDVYETERYRNKDIRKSNRRRKRTRSKIPVLFLILSFALLIFLVYLYHSTRPEVVIDGVVESIKNADLTRQEKVFDRLSNINEILASSFSENEEDKDKFLKSNYNNLSIKIKSEKETENGLMVNLEVSNVDFIEVLDSIKEDQSNFVRKYLESLENENQKKHTKEATLLLKRKFFKYKIYESPEFVDAILGGALQKYKKE